MVIEGNIGAGKSTLAKMLAEKHNARLILERFTENPFLSKFYDAPERYAFQMELSFLADRYRQINEELKELDLFKPFTIADYYLMKSHIFSSINLKGDEFKLFRQVFDIVHRNTPKPDLLVYLHTSLNNLARNIKSRGRFFEQKIQMEYLVQIQEGYMAYLKTQNEFPVLMLDMSNLDFVINQSDFEKINNAIFSEKIKIGLNKVSF